MSCVCEECLLQDNRLLPEVWAPYFNMFVRDQQPLFEQPPSLELSDDPPNPEVQSANGST